MPIVVFDTNVLVSSIIHKGLPDRCVQLARDARIHALTCPELLDELHGVLQRKKFNFDPGELAAAQAEILGFAELIYIPGELHGASSDPDDDKVLECAVIGGADFIVTGDRRHLLPMKNFRGIKIVSPAELLAIIAAP